MYLQETIGQLITAGNKTGQIRFHTLPRGLNLIYTPNVDDNSPATLRLSRAPKTKRRSFMNDGEPSEEIVYPSDKEVEIVMAALSGLITKASRNTLESNRHVVKKNGQKFGSVTIRWYVVSQSELI